ncbi:MAG: ATP phosphoribosyltransferase [Clostridiales bacterium]|nr:ATP phosphoribosyltransferase [Clostridiales bacterium]
MNKLTIALAKGRLGEEGLRLFENTELEIVREINSRKLVFNNEAGEVSYIFVKPSDVVTYVEKGVADIGIVGKDVILESQSDVYEIMDLKFGKCQFAIAGFRNQKLNKKNEILKIASKYPNYVQKIFAGRDQKIEVIKLNGSVELAPLMKLSDVIVDIVETGNTLRDNGLVVLESLEDISARLIVNKVSYRFKYEKIQMIEKLLGGIL